MMITEEECERRFQIGTATLRSDLQAVREIADKLQYDLKIAHWAITGVLNSDRRIDVRVSPVALAGGEKIQELAYYLARNTADRFIREIGLAFRDHAEFYGLKRHVAYLEMQAQRYGMPHRSWEEECKLVKDRHGMYAEAGEVAPIPHDPIASPPARRPP